MLSLTSFDKLQSNTIFNISIATRFFYKASLNDDMFRPFYIGHHQAVHFLILKQTIQYTKFFCFCQRDLVHIYEGWNFNSGNYLFTTDTKKIHVSKFYCPSV